MRFILLSFLLLGFLNGTFTEIVGQNKEYAGKKLRFFKYTDPVTLEKEPVFILEVDANGSFKANAAVDQTTFVFSEFGIYKGNLFLEPNQAVELLLPPLREKSFAEQKNPYFSPVEFWIATKEGTHLNDKVSAFDNQLNLLTDKYFNQLYFQQSKSAFDSVRINLQKQFDSGQPEAFIQHKNLKLKAVEADVFRQPAGKITPALSETKPAYWNHPAFIQLFEKTFSGKLSFEAKAMQGNEIRKAIAGADVAYFSGFIKSNYGVTGALADLILLKMLHDGFYSGDFSQESILKFLGARHFTANQNQTIRKVAVNVTQKLMHLRVGSKSPVICLKNTDGNKVCTNETSDKFKYILFADTEMIVVKEQLKYLAKIEELFSKHLEIYVVLLKTDLIEMKVFLVEENIPGVHLVDTDREFIEKYRVKSFPAAYLLNGNHEVVFQDAKAPLDGFEQQFGTFLRQHLFQQQRNQAQ
jgi:hypothetical protein